MAVNIPQMLKILKKEHAKERSCGLRYRSPLQLMVATILSAQCTDERVNKVTPGLFKKYKTLKDFANAKQASFEKDIRSTGFYKNKAKNIIAAAKMIQNDFKGRIPKTMEELIKLPGVARKTANIILSEGFGKIEGIAVDTHVKRLSNRLRLTKNSDPKKIEQDLMKKIPKRDWWNISSLLIWHGRKVCNARKPNCKQCKLNKMCPSAFKC